MLWSAVSRQSLNSFVSNQISASALGSVSEVVSHEIRGYA